MDPGRVMKVSEVHDFSPEQMTCFPARKKAYMGVSKNSGTPKRMVYNGEPC